MKSENYTFIFIPNDEKNSKTFYFSKRRFDFILVLFVTIIISALSVVSYFVVKLPEYRKIEKNHAKFVSERMKI